MVDQNVPLPTEPTEQMPLTPTASAAVDIKNTATFNDRAMHDNDEPWATEADHRTSWNKYVQERDVSRHVVWNCFARISEPRQRVSLQTCVNFSLGHKDIIASMLQHPLWNAKQVGQHLLVRAQVDAKSFLAKVRPHISSG